MLLKSLRNSEILLFDERPNRAERNSFDWLDYLYPKIQLEKNNSVTHITPKGDVLLTCREGIIEITLDNEKFIIEESQSMLIPINSKYSMKGIENSKISLITLFS